MHLDIAAKKQNGKTYVRYLLRESYRENGKVKKRTIANISPCNEKEIQAIKLALEHKDNLAALESIEGKLECKQGLSVGAIVLLKSVAERLGISRSLGSGREGKLALWQVMSRIIEQGSRLSAVRLARRHAICDLIDLEYFNEDDLYKNLDWLSEQQRVIEKKLFNYRFQGKVKPNLYLYDVTSSYFEGVNNELAEWGYNRDRKRGKMQIVIGLLTDEEGIPVSVEVFKGNSNDLRTFTNQVKKVADDFKIEEVTMVGDRGMIKTKQIKDLHEHNFHYITALTKPQIETLISSKIIDLELFDEDICEVENAGIRYILRRNPVRVSEIENNRQSKIKKIKTNIDWQNKYLNEHKRAKSSVAEGKIKKLIKKLRLTDFTSVEIEGKKLLLKIDDNKKADTTLLDGCYVIKTDLTKGQVSDEVVHQRYKDLAMVELGFRTMKTGLLETRPIYVQKEKRTRGHVFVVMLAYCLIQELKKIWRDMDITVEEGVNELTAICSVEINIKGARYQKILKPAVLGRNLLKLADVTLPDVLAFKGVNVDTKKKLATERKQPIISI
ncbi:MAG: IS1634 family transposase [Elusimicrobiota bacterium]